MAVLLFVAIILALAVLGRVLLASTLSWYIFWDLLKIFLAAVGAIAGIMSFGALLRPLTQFGLDGSQVVWMLMYFNPAMTTYSLPIAALFATTIVYGRLAADNELTACRASGISYLTIAFPAVALGLFACMISLGMLFFLVPRCTLGAEEVIYSNLAKLVATQIERTHTIRIGPRSEYSIFAQEAILPPADPAKPDEQTVKLIGPMFIRNEPKPTADGLYLPREFWIAREATAVIKKDADQQRLTLTVRLDGGSKFPRSFVGGMQAGVESTQIGPVLIPSPIREHAKFMDIRQLVALSKDLSKSKKIQSVLADFIREEQERQYRAQLLEQFNAPAGEVRFASFDGEYVIARSTDPAYFNGEEIILHTPGAATTQSTTAPADAESPVRLTEQRRGRITLNATAAEIRLKVRADSENQRMVVSIEMYGATLDTGEGPMPQRSFTRSFSVAMPESLARISQKSAHDFLVGPSSADKRRLNFEIVSLSNYIQSECHARISFSFSCLALVLVGCALGLMFRSGNFLTAFAVSVVPALLCVVVTVTGQHTIERVPFEVSELNNPIMKGLVIVYAGPATVLLIALALGMRLRKQ